MVTTNNGTKPTQCCSYSGDSATEYKKKGAEFLATPFLSRFIIEFPISPLRLVFRDRRQSALGDTCHLRNYNVQLIQSRPSVLS